MEGDDTWLLWQLVDSALPTGGFVASSGLETAFQLGLVTTPIQLAAFIRSSVHTFAYSSLPFVTEAYKLTEQYHHHQQQPHQRIQEEPSNPTVQPPPVRSDSKATSNQTNVAVSQLFNSFTDLDHLFHASNSHAAVRRASVAQGTSLLILYMKSFRSRSSPPSKSAGTDSRTPAAADAHDNDLARDFKAAIRLDRAKGHFPVCFGMVAQMLGLSLDKSQHLFMFMFVRQIVSSAVRLNIVGPYQAQIVLANAKTWAEGATTVARYLSIDQVAQTAPMVDMMQGAHERLYSKVFNS
ncbi:hypothetical protein IWQ60_001415 [Tieghemiomyces parasiticus]|uniref:Urease accessory protein UreF n=1 Tax=Tieghemiomyces parasiticus TaxID=78921 RepID=A0A9W8AE14_9FUNG|nr:hypothetical protein IWQ60_001415 [Tieghemiomyces parasiticus]